MLRRRRTPPARVRLGVDRCGCCTDAGNRGSDRQRDEPHCAGPQRQRRTHLQIVGDASHDDSDQLGDARSPGDGLRVDLTDQRGRNDDQRGEQHERRGHHERHRPGHVVGERIDDHVHDEHKSECQQPAARCDRRPRLDIDERERVVHEPPDQHHRTEYSGSDSERSTGVGERRCSIEEECAAQRSAQGHRRDEGAGGHCCEQCRTPNEPNHRDDESDDRKDHDPHPQGRIAGAEVGIRQVDQREERRHDDRDPDEDHPDRIERGNRTNASSPGRRGCTCDQSVVGHYRH